MKAKLCRSRKDSMIAGVCGGLGEYLGIDSTLVRLFFVLATFSGLSLLAYPLLWLIVPPEGHEVGTPGETCALGAQEMAERARHLSGDLRGGSRPSGQVSLFLGATLIGLGALFLLQQLNLVWLRWLDFDVLWPLLLVVGGVALLLRRGHSEEKTY